MSRNPNINIETNMHFGNLTRRHRNSAAITTVKAIIPAIIGIPGFKFSKLNPWSCSVFWAY